MADINSANEGNFNDSPKGFPLSLIVNRTFSNENLTLCWVAAFIALVVTFFIYKKNLEEIKMFKGNVEKIQARVTSSTSVNFQAGGRRGNLVQYRTAFATTYSFRLGKKVYHGQSFSPRGLGDTKTAEVEYLKSNPDISRIVGMKANDLDPFIFFIMAALNIVLLGYSSYTTLVELVSALGHDYSYNEHLESISFFSTLTSLIAPFLSLAMIGVFVYYLFV